MSLEDLAVLLAAILVIAGSRFYDVPLKDASVLNCRFAAIPAPQLYSLGIRVSRELKLLQLLTNSRLNDWSSALVRHSYSECRGGCIDDEERRSRAADNVFISPHINSSSGNHIVANKWNCS